MKSIDSHAFPSVEWALRFYYPPQIKEPPEFSRRALINDAGQTSFRFRQAS